MFIKWISVAFKDNFFMILMIIYEKYRFVGYNSRLIFSEFNISF